MLVKLVVVLSLLLLKSSLAWRVLLIGDSIDRYGNIDWCNKRNKRLPVEWTDKYLTVLHGNNGGYVCTFDKPTQYFVANLHIFGTQDSKPYFSDNNLEALVPNIVNTKERIEYALNRFYEIFPPPDVIYLHTNIWDFVYLYSLYPNEINAIGSKIWNESLSKFESGLKHRVNHLQGYLTGHNQTTTEVALRTAAYVPFFNGNSSGNLYQHALNEVVRKVARELDVTLYDFHNDLWQRWEYNYSQYKLCIRDTLHPKPEYTTDMVDRMIGLRYSRYLQFPARHSGHHIKINTIRTLHTSAFGEQTYLYHRLMRIVPFTKGAEWNATYILSVDCNSKKCQVYYHAGLNQRYMTLLKLYTSDILEVPKALFDNASKEKIISRGVALRSNLSDILSNLESAKIVVTLKSLNFFMTNRTRRFIRFYPSNDIMEIWKLTSRSIINLNDYHDIFLPLLDEAFPVTGTEIPDIYREGRVFRLQSEPTHVYVFQNKAKLPVKSEDFVKYEINEDSIILVDSKEDLEII